MKKIRTLISLFTATALMLLLTGMSLAAPLPEYDDISEDDWYYDAVRYCIIQNLFRGTDEVSFSPHKPMTRAMLVTVLGRASQVSTKDFDAIHFDDVEPGSYYAPYIEWARSTGILAGIGEGKVAPDAPITRQDIAVILWRLSAGEDASGLQTSFADAETIAPYAVNAIGWAVREGILQGDSGNIDPAGVASRAQVAQMLYNMKQSAPAPSPVPEADAEDEALFSINREDVASIQLRSGANGSYAYLDEAWIVTVLDLLNNTRYTGYVDEEPRIGWSYALEITFIDSDDILSYDLINSGLRSGDPDWDYHRIYQVTNLQAHFDLFEEWIPIELFDFLAIDVEKIQVLSGTTGKQTEITNRETIESLAWKLFLLDCEEVTETKPEDAVAFSYQITLELKEGADKVVLNLRPGYLDMNGKTRASDRTTQLIRDLDGLIGS